MPFGKRKTKKFTVLKNERRQKKQKKSINDTSKILVLENCRSSVMADDKNEEVDKFQDIMDDTLATIKVETETETFEGSVVSEDEGLPVLNFKIKVENEDSDYIETQKVTCDEILRVVKVEPEIYQDIDTSGFSQIVRVENENEYSPQCVVEKTQFFKVENENENSPQFEVEKTQFVKVENENENSPQSEVEITQFVKVENENSYLSEIDKDGIGAFETKVGLVKNVIETCSLSILPETGMLEQNKQFAEVGQQGCQILADRLEDSGHLSTEVCEAVNSQIEHSQPIPQLLVQNLSSLIDTDMSQTSRFDIAIVPCIYCEESFYLHPPEPYIKHLQNHLDIINNLIERYAASPLKEYEFLKRHLREKGLLLDIPARVCRKKGCFFIYVDDSAGRLHNQEKHPNHRSVCQKFEPKKAVPYDDTSNAKVHIDHEVADNNDRRRTQHPCEKCYFMNNKIVHVCSGETWTQKDKGEDENVCVNCGRKFNTAAELKSHLICDHPVGFTVMTVHANAAVKSDVNGVRKVTQKSLLKDVRKIQCYPECTTNSCVTNDCFKVKTNGKKCSETSTSKSDATSLSDFTKLSEMSAVTSGNSTETFGISADISGNSAATFGNSDVTSGVSAVTSGKSTGMTVNSTERQLTTCIRKQGRFLPIEDSVEENRCFEIGNKGFENTLDVEDEKSDKEKNDFKETIKNNDFSVELPLMEAVIEVGTRSENTKSTTIKENDPKRVFNLDSANVCLKNYDPDNSFAPQIKRIKLDREESIGKLESEQSSAVNESHGMFVRNFEKGKELMKVKNNFKHSDQLSSQSDFLGKRKSCYIQTSDMAELVEDEKSKDIIHCVYCNVVFASEAERTNHYENAKETCMNKADAFLNSTNNKPVAYTEDRKLCVEIVGLEPSLSGSEIDVFRSMCDIQSGSNKTVKAASDDVTETLKTKSLTKDDKPKNKDDKHEMGILSLDTTDASSEPLRKIIDEIEEDLTVYKADGTLNEEFGEGQDIFCLCCKLPWVTVTEKMMHEKHMEEVKYFPCKFHGCKSAFNSYEGRRMHVEEKHVIYHPILINHKCVVPGCFKGFSRKGEFSEHYFRYRPCEESFYRLCKTIRKDLKVNVMSAKTNLEFLAMLTNDEFRQVSEIEQYAREDGSRDTVGNSLWYVCPVMPCEYGSKGKADILEHIRTKHKNVFKI